MSDLFGVLSKWGFSSIYRIILPGLFVVLLLIPAINPIVPNSLRVDELTDIVTIILPSTLVAGLCFPLFRSQIYRVFEGRLFWPRWLGQKITVRLDKKVRRQLEMAELQSKSSGVYKEIWNWLRIFPLDSQGNPIAKRPTLVGNIMLGYEEYPRRRYGMDAAFYWYRLWPTVPENFAKQADEASAQADCLMYISFSGFSLGILYLIIAALEAILVCLGLINNVTLSGVFQEIPYWLSLLALGFGGFLIGYVTYRLSLPIHRTNGEFFKATFDLYRKNILEISNVTQEEKDKWNQAWSYLQYMYVRCPKCQQYYYADLENCPHCSEATEQKETIASSGGETKNAGGG